VGLRVTCIKSWCISMVNSINFDRSSPAWLINNRLIAEDGLAHQKCPCLDPLTSLTELLFFSPFLGACLQAGSELVCKSQICVHYIYSLIIFYFDRKMHSMCFFLWERNTEFPGVFELSGSFSSSIPLSLIPNHIKSWWVAPQGLLIFINFKTKGAYM